MNDYNVYYSNLVPIPVDVITYIFNELSSIAKCNTGQLPSEAKTLVAQLLTDIDKERPDLNLTKPKEEIDTMSSGTDGQ